VRSGGGSWTPTIGAYRATAWSIRPEMLVLFALATVSSQAR
jgi:hypothetical protein